MRIKRTLIEQTALKIPRGPAYIDLGVAALAAAATAGASAASPAHISAALTGIGATYQPAKPVPPVQKSRSPSVADAFQAATGRRTAFTAKEKGEIVTTKPLRIIRLPFGPALLTERKIQGGCHACAGAIGIYYLKEAAGKFLITGRWPEAVKGWGWGAPPWRWRLTNRFTSYPAIFATGGYMGQGIMMESATLTELSPSGPVTSESIGTGYTDEAAVADGDRPACVVEGKIANMRRDRSFDVLVSGSVNAVDGYAKQQGRYVAVTKIDWDFPCER